MGAMFSTTKERRRNLAARKQRSKIPRETETSLSGRADRLSCSMEGAIREVVADGWAPSIIFSKIVFFVRKMLTKIDSLCTFF